MKHYPSYELVAWTDHGRLRMIPSLVEELARPDLERLEEQDRCPEDGTAEIDWLIGRSCEYERLALRPPALKPSLSGLRSAFLLSI